MGTGMDMDIGMDMVWDIGLGYGLAGNGLGHGVVRTDLASRPVQVVLDFVWDSAPQVFDNT